MEPLIFQLGFITYTKVSILLDQTKQTVIDEGNSLSPRICVCHVRNIESELTLW